MIFSFCRFLLCVNLCLLFCLLPFSLYFGLLCSFCKCSVLLFKIFLNLNLFVIQSLQFFESLDISGSYFSSFFLLLSLLLSCNPILFLLLCNSCFLFLLFLGNSCLLFLLLFSNSSFFISLFLLNSLSFFFSGNSDLFLLLCFFQSHLGQMFLPLLSCFFCFDLFVGQRFLGSCIIVFNLCRMCIDSVTKLTNMCG